MLNRSIRPFRGRSTSQDGATLIEVLVTILIASFGLLGLAGLQAKMNSSVFESYQRSQALALVQDMTQRMQANRNNNTSYIVSTTAPVGTGDSQPADCSTLATRAAIDICEWSNALKGSAESAASGGANAGAMVGGRGCVEQLQVQNTTAGICQPAVYRVTVTWQGFAPTVAPSVTCAANAYGSDDLRRAMSLRVVIPLPSCS
jgi:type IV pilus assembly protein PilV